MAHSNKHPLLRPSKEERRRREATLDRLSTLELAQMLDKQRLFQAVNPLQAQAHSDTLPNQHSSLPMVCHNSQHTDSQATQTQRRNSRPQHMVSLLTASPHTKLLKLDTLSSLRLAVPSQVCRA
jgi:hypothetical protein